MQTQDSKLHFEVTPHYIAGTEKNPQYLMQDLANCVHSNNGLLEHLSAWNRQYDGNNVIYLVKGTSKDATGYHFVIRIGNIQFNVYTQRKLWFSFTDSHGRYVTRLHTTISHITPVYRREHRTSNKPKRIYDYNYDNHNCDRTRNEKMNYKRSKIDRSISENDIDQIHQFLDTIRNQSKIKNNDNGFISVPVLSTNTKIINNTVENNSNLSTALTTKR